MTTPPTDPTGETAAALVKGLVSAIPFVGGVIAEVGNLYLNPLERRKQRWLAEVSLALNSIRDRFALMPADLESNERFVSFLYQTTILALKNHQQQKLDALRHALIASVASSQISDDMSFQFLRYIDELSVTHLAILSALAERAVKIAEHTSLEQVYSEIYDALGIALERPAFRVFLQDLDSRFLIRLGDIDDFPEYQSLQARLLLESSRVRPLEVAPLGQMFLTFLRQ